ncbi:MAG: lipoprotein [Gammaproteobacteria bacterium]|nr:lipoprotein [Gammaproteobacteria bacterium]
MNLAGNRTLRRQLVTACAVLVALAGCGNKSDLVMPEEPPAQSQDEATQSTGAQEQGTASDKPAQEPKANQ